MRYSNGSSRLRDDARTVSRGVAASQSQESLAEQLQDVHILATRFGLYDAADWLQGLFDHIDQYRRDYGVVPSDSEISSTEERALLERAIAQIDIRKHALDHIDDEHTAAAHAINAIRVDELVHVVEMLHEMKTRADRVCELVA